MTYTVIELTEDGSMFDTNTECATKEEAVALAKQYNADSRNGSRYFVEKAEVSPREALAAVLKY